MGGLDNEPPGGFSLLSDREIAPKCRFLWDHSLLSAKGATIPLYSESPGTEP